MFADSEKLTTIYMEEPNVFHVDPKVFFNLAIEEVSLNFTACNNATLNVTNQVDLKAVMEKKKFCYDSKVNEMFDFNDIITADSDYSTKYNEYLNLRGEITATYENITRNVTDNLKAHKEKLNECNGRSSFGTAAWLVTLFLSLIIISLTYELRKTIRKTQEEGRVLVESTSTDWEI